MAKGKTRRLSNAEEFSGTWAADHMDSKKAKGQSKEKSTKAAENRIMQKNGEDTRRCGTSCAQAGDKKRKLVILYWFLY